MLKKNQWSLETLTKGRALYRGKEDSGGAIKLKIEKNSCSIFKCEIKVRGKYSVNRVFNGLAHNHISHFTLGSDVMFTTVQTLACFSICVEWFLFGKISFYAL